MRRLLVALGILCILGVGVLVAAWRWDDHLRYTTQVAGDSVVVAIEGFKREAGRLPHTLDELVPKYLSKIPPPTWGARKWQFEPFTDGHYDLVACENAGCYPVYGYNSSSREWFIDR